MSSFFRLTNNINIICLESEALKSLVKQLAAELKEEDYPWIDEKEASAVVLAVVK